MQEVLKWNREIAAYLTEFAQQRANHPKRCQKCGCRKFYRWGSYQRNVIEESREHRISVRRVSCAKCRATTSYLPDFCISRVQYSAGYVMLLLSWALGVLGGVATAPTLNTPSAHESLRRRAYAYRQRFVKKLSLWQVFLRVKGMGAFPGDKKGRIGEIFKALETLWQAGTLLCGFHAATGKHFMANK